MRHDAIIIIPVTLIEQLLIIIVKPYPLFGNIVITRSTLLLVSLYYHNVSTTMSTSVQSRFRKCFNSMGTKDNNQDYIWDTSLHITQVTHCAC